MAAKNVLVDVTEAGRLGGEARAANMSPEARSEAARAAVKARWAKKKAESATEAKGAKKKAVKSPK